MMNKDAKQKDVHKRQPSRAPAWRIISEKMSKPARPIAVSIQFKEIAKIQPKAIGKKNWLTGRGIDFTISMGFIWGICKIFSFFYLYGWNTKWIRTIGAFSPLRNNYISANF